MEFKLFSNQLIQYLITTGSKITDTQMQQRVLDVLSVTDFEKNISLNKSNLVPNDFFLNNKFETKLITLETNENNNLKQIHKLYNDNYLIVNSDAPSKIYDSNFNLIQNLPFRYSAVTSGETSNYKDVTKSYVLNFSSNGFNNDTSLIFFAIKDQHIVQVFKYYQGVFEYLKTIGTLDTNGNGTDLLDKPLAVAAILNNSNTISCYVSSEGQAINSEIGFLKKFTFNYGDGSFTEAETTLSYPKKNLTTNTISSGSLLYSETSIITQIELFETDILHVINGDEIGIIDFNVTPPITKSMSKGTVKNLEYNDSILAPTCFYKTENFLVLGDIKGHVTKMANLNEYLVHIGILMNSNETTTYPNMFKSIDSIFINGSDLYIISDKKLLKTNLLKLQNETLKFKIEPTGYSYRIINIWGFENNSNIEVSFDDKTYFSLCECKSKTVELDQTLYIKVSKSLESYLTSNPLNENGLLVTGIV